MSSDEKLPVNNEYGDHFRELMEKSPAWVARWGITVIAFSIVAIIVMGWFLKYPDVISANITITSSKPPAVIKSSVSTEVDSVLVENGDHVIKGQLIMLLGNTMNYGDFKWLYSQISNDSNLVANEIITREIDLGSLQGYFNDYQTDLKKLLRENHYLKYRVTLASLENALKVRRERLSFEKKKLDYFSEMLALSKVEIERTKKLLDQGVYSKTDYEKQLRIYLTNQQQLQDLKIMISNTKDELNDYESEINLLRIDYRLNQEISLSAVESSRKILIEEMEEWQRTFALRSPISGQVNFHSRIFKSNSNVLSGDELFTVVPLERGEILGYAYAPQTNAGKLKEGQAVNIFLANYPFHQYGLIQGIVSNISLVPSETRYLIEVELPEGLKTTYDKEIEFKPDLEGKASIVTEDLNIIERIFYGIRSIFLNNS